MLAIKVTSVNDTPMYPHLRLLKRLFAGAEIKCLRLSTRKHKGADREQRIPN